MTFPYECAEGGTPECRSKKDAFVSRGGRFLYNESSSTRYSDDNSSIVLSDCYVRCISNCSCVGFNTLNMDGTGCTFWGQGARFELSDGFGDEFFLLNSSYPIPSDDKSDSRSTGKTPFLLP